MQQRDCPNGNIDSNFCDPIKCKCGGGKPLLERNGSKFCNSRGSHLLDREEEYDWILTLAEMWDDPNNDFNINIPF
jgi:hypothetical protein